MAEIVVLAYGFMAMFVLQASATNLRLGRPHGDAIMFAGRVMISASTTLAVAAAAMAALSALDIAAIG